MDCQRAEIYELTLSEKAEWEQQNNRLLATLTKEQVRDLKSKSNKRRKKYMKHQPCPCGSGKKFLKCCWHLHA